MTQEEHDLITRFIERVGGAAPKPSFGSVPSAAAAPLPPVDPDADRLIGALLTANPEARYRLTQTAFVQEQALVQAQAQIKVLTEQLQAAQQAAQQQPQRGGFLSSIFGGGPAPQAPGQPGGPVWNRGAPPPQQYAQPPQQYAQPGYGQPGMMGGGMLQPRGSGFLGGALQTAAGVAGGVLVGNALMGMFEGGGHTGASLGDLGQGSAGLGGAGTGSGASPWGSDGGSDAGSGGFTDNAGWNADPGPAAPPDAGWQDASAAPDSGGGGWDAGGGDSGGGDSGGGDWS